MDQVVFRMQNAEELKSDPQFLLGLQLSRLYNALNANLRAYSGIKSDNPSDKRDRVERVLYHGAIISECLSTLQKVRSQIETLPSWQSNLSQVNSVKKQMDQPDSFARTVLKTIRDKVVYHYDTSVIKEIISDFPLHDGIRFGDAQSNTGHDLCFTLVDEMTVHYLIKQFDPTRPEIEVYELIMEGLTENGNNLLRTLMELITDLLAKHMEWK